MTKRRSRILISAILCVILALCLVAFTACDKSLQDRIRDLQAQVNGYEADFSEKTVTVYIGEGENNCHVVKTRKAFLHDLLKDMKSDGEISQYEYQGDGIDAFLTAIDGLQQDVANHKYYSVWHSVDSYSLKSIYSSYAPSRTQPLDDGFGTTFATTNYNDILLYYSNVGVGLLPLVDGGIYAIFVN